MAPPSSLAIAASGLVSLMLQGCTTEDGNISTSTTTTRPTIQRAKNPQSGRDAFVHLFEWSWYDVAEECEQFLGPKGFTAVQVSPPNEHIAGEQWWTRYQPVTFELISRSGNESEFADMVKRCSEAGVGIYVDAVINHVAAGSGTSITGKSYGNRSTPIFTQDDMHHTDGNPGGNCEVKDYSNKTNVQECDLLGLPDLCTSCETVQRKVADYLNHLSSLGVAGFRVDAAKHQDAGELGQLLSRTDSSMFRFHEVTTAPGEAVTPNMYTSIGDVTEFNYATQLAPNFVNQGKLQYLESFGESWGFISTDSAVVFMDNHDTQRNEAKLTYKNGDVYRLANIFMLAHPYGYPKIMSSFYFDDFDQAPPSGHVHEGQDVRCGEDRPWVCEHRWPALANMVAWRAAAGTAWVENFQVEAPNSIAFCRGGVACVALNRGSAVWSASLNLTMPAGTYCNIIESDDPSSCPAVVVGQDGTTTFDVPAVGAVAIHVEKRVRDFAIAI